MPGLVGFDESLFLAVNGWSSPTLDTLFSLATWLGNGIVLAVLVLGSQALFDRRRLRTHALAMVLSVSIGALAVEAVKRIAGRERPVRHFAARVERGDAAVHTPAARLADDRSFPSGHAQSAFGTATYLSFLYPPLAPVFLLLAALVALSRVYLGVHFPIDVATGALFGAVFSSAGFLLYRRLLRRRNRVKPEPPAAESKS